MVGLHHQLNGHEFEQDPGDGEGQGSLACCNPWVHKESDATEQQQQSTLGAFRPLNDLWSFKYYLLNSQ